MKKIRIYVRQGCHLCERLLEELMPLARDQILLDVVDIESRSEWKEKFETQIPVVEYEGKFVCRYKLDVSAIRTILANLSES